MQVLVEKREGIRCVLSIDIPSSDIDQEISKRIKKIASTAKINGFRPGKIPLSFIKKKYGDSVRSEVISDILPDKYTQAIRDEKLNAAGVEVQILQNEEGKSLKCKINVELFPDVVIKNLNLIEIKKPVVALGEKEHKKMIESLRYQLATWDRVDLQVESGHKVTIDFVGRIDGETFSGGSGNSSEVTIGSGQMIRDFEEGIIGMKKQEEKKIKVTFPHDYQNEELRDKTAEFDILVIDVKKVNLPEVNENFFNKLGIKGGEESFHKEIKQNMTRELKSAIHLSIKSQVFDGLAKLIDIEIPQTLVKREIDRKRNDFLARMGAYSKSKIKVEDIPDNLFEEKAKYDVKLSLIVHALIKQENFEADETSINSMIEEMTAIYEDPQQVISHTKKDKKEVENIKAIIVENKIVDWICQQAKVEEKKEDFFSLVNDKTLRQPTL